MTEPEHAAFVLVAAALRQATACAHDEPHPGACPHCEPLPPLAQVALTAAPLLCPAAADPHPATLHAALEVVQALAHTADHSDLAQQCAALQEATETSDDQLGDRITKVQDAADRHLNDQISGDR